MRQAEATEAGNLMDTFCTTPNLLQLFGLGLTGYAMFQLYYDCRTCFNYVHLSMVWTTLEICSFWVWIIARVTAAWYTEQFD